MLVPRSLIGLSEFLLWYPDAFFHTGMWFTMYAAGMNHDFGI